MRMSYDMYIIIIWSAVLGTLTTYRMCDGMIASMKSHVKRCEFHLHDCIIREAMIPENPVLADDLIIK